ncbi:MAG: hypothetical protein GY847_00985 [Proteobacteria bacterium]|nr:hypothetical protein [Pseudomonadota bacterium]
MVSVMIPLPASGLRTISTDEIRPGMKGYGLTVFKGTEPERFDVEVVSVVPNFLLRQNIILIRCDHPVTDKAGVIGGMSGSPIFIEGRLAGALAYGWRFSKEPLAGVTSIDDMLDVLNRKVRGTGIGRWGRTAAVVAPQKDNRPKRSSLAGVDYFSLFRDQEAGQIVPARTPLTLGGFLGPARAILEKALSKFGIDPMTRGGSTGGGDGPKRFVPGSAIGVQLIRGDMSATAIGTVTMVKGKNVLAFGHPMFNMGEGYLPVTTARIHTVIASLMRSNKLGSPLNVVGSLVQDRNACIMARTDLKAAMIPVKMAVVEDRSRTRESYEVEIALHRLLTPRFLHAALVNIIIHAASDSTDVTAELTGVMKVAGRPPITLHDSGTSRSGLIPLTSYFRPISVIDNILNNPFENASVESLEFEVKLHYGLELATIVGVYLTAEQPEPGEVVNINVRLKKFDAEEEILTVPLRIPQAAAGKKIQIEVAGGDFITPVMAAPRNLDDIIANVSRFYPPKSLVVGVNIPGEGVSLRGRVLERLPASAVNALQPTAGYEQLSRHRTALRKVMPTPFLVQGKETIRLTVGGLRNK